MLATTVRGLHRESGERVEVPEGASDGPSGRVHAYDACLPLTQKRFYMIFKLIMNCQGVRRGFSDGPKCPADHDVGLWQELYLCKALTQC